MVRLLAVFALAAGVANAAESNPVTRVVGLLTDMKKECEKEAKEDKKIFEKYDCWCHTNEEEKTAAVESAKKSIEDLTTSIEEYIARKAQLGTEIEELEASVKEQSDALETATAMREKEKAEFLAEEADFIDARSALQQAVAVLKKVQLAQVDAPTALIQVRGIVSNIKFSQQYQDVMRKDFWGLLSSLGEQRGDSTFLGSHGGVITGFQQQPIEGGGGAPGAKSYNAASSQIFGMLSQMLETFSKDLAASQKEELLAQVAFHDMKAAKEGEIRAATNSIAEKSDELALTSERLAQAKQDLEDTKASLAADQQFLIELDKQCSTARSEYSERLKTRMAEIMAIGEAIKILTDDDAKDLFARSEVGGGSFLQVSSAMHGRAGMTAQMKAARKRAADAILSLARRKRNVALASLAVSIKLDAFTKVKEMCDELIAELKKQQAEEVKKYDACKADIHGNEMDTMKKESEKKDLEATISDLDGALMQLTADLDTLKQQVAENQIALKRASEDRKAENLEFQQIVADQRATVTILNKALEKLQSFYSKQALVEVRAHSHVGRQDPPPPSGKAYQKSAAGSGVVSTLENIIQDAEQAEQEAVQAEQEASNAYAAYVSETNTVLETAATQITEKTISKENAEAEKVVAEKDLAAAVTELESLAGTNSALHDECDYVLKNFNIRQTARQEEIEAIQQAKQILSGADFGL
jgi:hypothetical protein